MRQWDLTTGQCVMTMDILWAISHPPTSGLGNTIPGHLFPGAAAAAGTFAVPTPPFADGTWDMYQDFVGAVQFWGYALISGSADGGVRMWDSKLIRFYLSWNYDSMVLYSANRSSTPDVIGSHGSHNLPPI